MKLRVKTNDIKNILKTLITINSTAATIGYILTDPVLIKVYKNKLEIMLNNFDTSAIFNLDVTDSEDGEAVLSLGSLCSAVDSIMESFIDIYKNKSKGEIIIKTSKSESSILTNSIEDFNFDIKEKKDVIQNFKLDKNIIISGLRTVNHASLQNIIKPELATVYMYTNNSTLYFVASDSVRLSEIRYSIKGDIDLSVLIPNKNVKNIIKTLESSSSSDVSIDIIKGGMFFSTEHLVLYIKTTEGTFPIYKSIIPTKFDLEFVILKSDLQNFIKKARFFSNELNRLQIKDIKENTITLSFSNPKSGKTEDIMPIKNKLGDVESISSYNYKFINDVIQNIKDDSISFKINEGLKPLMLRGVEDTNFTAVISPLLEE